MNQVTISIDTRLSSDEALRLFENWLNVQIENDDELADAIDYWEVEVQEQES